MRWCPCCPELWSGGHSSSSSTEASYSRVSLSDRSKDAYRPGRGQGDNELLVYTGSSAADAVNLAMTDEGLSVISRGTSTGTSLIERGGPLNILKTSSSVHGVIPYQYILSVTYDSDAVRDPTKRSRGILQIATLRDDGQVIPSKRRLKLWQLDAFLDDQDVSGRSRVHDWCARVMDRAYSGTRPGKRFLVVINPFGGTGLAKTVWESVVRPIFTAAGCITKEQYTGALGTSTHAKQIAAKVNLSVFDAIVSISGDGIVHELLNGLASRDDASVALKMPIAPIPAGSGNALSVNLLGPEFSEDRALAALAAIKGSSIAMDLCSVTQSGRRSFSFLSQAFGLMADIDLGTENWRWMGDIRFSIGYVQGALQRRKYPFEISLNVVENDKAIMAQQYNARLKEDTPTFSPDSEYDGIPPLQYGTADDTFQHAVRHNSIPTGRLSPGWHTFTAYLMYLYAGKLPFVAKDICMFPPAEIDDGCIDVAIVGPISRIDALTGMDGAAEGKMYINPNTHYFKCKAFRVKPLKPENNRIGYISVDGEGIPNETLQVEVHQGLARVLSLNGRIPGKHIHLIG